MRDRPSFLAICVDQMQWNALSCAGHPDARTPNLDRLASGGVRFERAYCENPLCTPSRLSIFTGLSSRQHGVYTLGSLVSPDIPTVASVLKEAGYRTHASGKMHVQPWGLERQKRAGGDRGACLEGFHSWEDESLWLDGTITEMPKGWFGFEAVDYVGGHTDYVCGDYMNWLETEHPEHAKPLREDRHRMMWSCRTNPKARTPGGLATTYHIGLPPELHYNTWIADRSVDFLRGLGDEEAFFLWTSFPDPHHPFAACGDYATMYDPASVTLPQNAGASFMDDPFLSRLPAKAHSVAMTEYNETALREMIAQTLGMISHVDDQVGRLLDELDEQGRDEDTVVVFLSDHGEYLGAHGLITKGYQPYEEILRVPYLWRAPAEPASASHAAAGRVETGLASLLDFAPTVLDYAGIPLDCLVPRCNPAADSGVEVPWFDGISLRGAIDSGDPLADRALLVCKEENSGLSLQGYETVLRGRVFLHGRWKLVLFAPLEGGALFDLKNDPGETTNLWDDPDHAATRDRLVGDFARHTIYRDYLGLGRVSGP